MDEGHQQTERRQEPPADSGLMGLEADSLATCPRLPVSAVTVSGIAGASGNAKGLPRCQSCISSSPAADTSNILTREKTPFVCPVHVLVLLLRSLRPGLTAFVVSTIACEIYCLFTLVLPRPGDLLRPCAFSLFTMASSENNNNANEHGAGPERDAVPTTVVESTEQVKEEANPEPATETGERPSVDKSGEGVVERAEETKLRPDVAERAESSGPVSTKQEPAPPDPRAEKSDIAPGTTAQPSTTEDSKPSPAHPVEVSSAESQPSGDDTNASSTQNPQPSVPGPNPSNVETQQSSEIENAPAEPSTHSAHEEPEDIGPSVTITLLLTSGARHPFKINGRYLRKRSIDVPDYDPFKMSVYTLKELILREWRTGTARCLKKIWRSELTRTC